MYYNGYGVPKNLKKAAECYDKASRLLDYTSSEFIQKYKLDKYLTK